MDVAKKTRVGNVFALASSFVFSTLDAAAVAATTYVRISQAVASASSIRVVVVISGALSITVVLSAIVVVVSQ